MAMKCCNICHIPIKCLRSKKQKYCSSCAPEAANVQKWAWYVAMKAHRKLAPKVGVNSECKLCSRPILSARRAKLYCGTCAMVVKAEQTRRSRDLKRCSFAAASTSASTSNAHKRPKLYQTPMKNRYDVSLITYQAKYYS